MSNTINIGIKIITMKRILIFCFIVLSAFPTFAQKINICGNINYKQTTNFLNPFERDFSLKFNRSESLYKEISIKANNAKTKIEVKDDGQQLDRTMQRNNLNADFAAIQ